MEFIKGTPMKRKRNACGFDYYEKEKREAYINPNHIDTAVYDPEKCITGITINGSTIALEGDVMREYEERVRRQAGDGRDD
jgi:hypothetical protein